MRSVKAALTATSLCETSQMYDRYGVVYDVVKCEPGCKGCERGYIAVLRDPGRVTHAWPGNVVLLSDDAAELVAFLGEEYRRERAWRIGVQDEMEQMRKRIDRIERAARAKPGSEKP